jgi:hypothetical protein
MPSSPSYKKRQAPFIGAVCRITNPLHSLGVKGMHATTPPNPHHKSYRRLTQPQTLHCLWWFAGPCLPPFNPHWKPFLFLGCCVTLYPVPVFETVGCNFVVLLPDRPILNLGWMYMQIGLESFKLCMKTDRAKIMPRRHLYICCVQQMV